MPQEKGLTCLIYNFRLSLTINRSNATCQNGIHARVASEPAKNACQSPEPFLYDALEEGTIT